MADSFHTNTHRINRHSGSGSILHLISDHSSVAEWNSSPSTGTDLRAGRPPPRQGNEAEERDSGAAAATKTALQALVHPEPRDQSSALPVHTTGAGGAGRVALQARTIVDLVNPSTTLKVEETTASLPSTPAVRRSIQL